MHTIEPYFKWRDLYTAEEDKKSPFYGRQYNEFSFTNKIYNYFIHPQWDSFGSSTLYIKIIFADYEKKYACIELIGEWNDCIDNDIMYLKREILEKLIEEGIKYFIIFCDNVLNFHSSDDCYYEEWHEEISQYNGWISFINIFDHVKEEMEGVGLQYYANFGPYLNNLTWQGKKPNHIFKEINKRLQGGVKQLR